MAPLLVVLDMLLDLNSHCGILVLLDFNHAFDTVDHSLLCCIVMHVGSTQYTVILFNSYMSDRGQRIDDIYSYYFKFKKRSSAEIYSWATVIISIYDPIGKVFKILSYSGEYMSIC